MNLAIELKRKEMYSLSKLYHKMNEIYPLFLINCWLVSTGVEKQVAYYFKSKNAEKKAVSGEIKDFYAQNADKIAANMQMLSDEKSRYIYKSLIDYRVTRKPLKSDVYSLDDQYFPSDIIKLENNEVFIDCGAFVGDTIHHLFRIAKKTDKQIKKIVAFEPEDKNYRLLKKYYKNYHSVKLVASGVSRENKKVLLSGESTYAKIVNNAGDNTRAIDVVRLDDVKSCEDATYIKMDIEGAELDALKGAHCLITNRKPKLAICIYHGMGDIVNIIPYIHMHYPEYKLYVRHHSRDTSETVLYAIP